VNDLDTVDRYAKTVGNELREGRLMTLAVLMRRAPATADGAIPQASI